MSKRDKTTPALSGRGILPRRDMPVPEAKPEPPIEAEDDSSAPRAPRQAEPCPGCGLRVGKAYWAGPLGPNTIESCAYCGYKYNSFDPGEANDVPE